MDRFGRVWVAVPSMVVLGVSVALVPLAQSALTLTIVGLLMGIGTGMGSGLVMTLGADLAPPLQRPVFLGIWRVFADVGSGLGPFVIAGTTALATLGVGIAAMGAVGLIGAGLLGVWVPRHKPVQSNSVGSERSR
jgi:MFS family permease